MKAFLLTAGLLTALSTMAAVNDEFGPPELQSPTAPHAPVQTPRAKEQAPAQKTAPQGETLTLAVPKRLSYKDIEVNSDRSLTIFRPSVYRAGELRKLDTYSGAGVCKLLSQGKKVYLYVDAKVAETRERSQIVRLDENGGVDNFYQTESGAEVLAYVICRPKTQAEWDQEAAEEKRQREWQREAEERRQQQEAREAAQYKKCLKDRREDRDLRCIPPRPGGRGLWGF